MNKILYTLLVISMIACNSTDNPTAVAPEKAATTTDGKPIIKNPAANNAKIVTNAQNPAAPQVVENYKAKNEGWLVNFDEAYKMSKKSGKPIMANFTGSDWCGWCKRLDKTVFHTPEFEKWSKENFVLLELDFPRRFRLPADVQQQNRNLQMQFGVRGYPSVWIFDAEKNGEGQYSFTRYGKTGYKPTFEEFQTEVEGFVKKG